MAIIKGKTTTGFAYKIDSDFVNDVEFLELFADVQNGDTLGVFNIIKKILGDDQKKALYDHIRTKKGVVPMDRLNDEITDILKVISEADETKK